MKVVAEREAASTCEASSATKAILADRAEGCVRFLVGVCCEVRAANRLEADVQAIRGQQTAVMKEYAGATQSTVD
jgi:hypothetical protein